MKFNRHIILLFTFIFSVALPTQKQLIFLSINFVSKNFNELALVAIIFIDDKSTLKVKDNSEVVITGKRTAASISKKINMDEGTIRATVKKQNTDFVIQTPTSVASVKGTDFWLVSDPETGDQIIGIEGIVGLVNNETGQEIDISEGMSGLSTPDGNVGLTETDPSSIPDDPSDDIEGPSQVKIYLEGPNGEQKVMIIEYQ